MSAEEVRLRLNLYRMGVEPFKQAQGAQLASAEASVDAGVTEQNVCILNKQIAQLDKPLHLLLLDIAASYGHSVTSRFVRGGAQGASPPVVADKARIACFANAADVCANESGDVAIAACTQVIEFREATGHDQAVHYVNRGIQYDAKGDFDRAIADFTEATRLDPENADAFKQRGTAYQAKGDYARAIGDGGETIRIEATAEAHRYRGIAYLYSGDLAKALTDVSRAIELDSKDAYAALWVDIVGQRNNVPSRLSQAVSEIDKTEWPGPVLRLFLGELDVAQILAAAEDEDATTKQRQVCQAHFYSGELALRSAKDEATRLFRLAADECPHSLIEWSAANAELKTLGVASAPPGTVQRKAKE